MSNIRAISTLLIIIGIPFFYISKAQALCTYLLPSSSVNVSNLVVQRNAALGSQIGAEVVAANVQFYSCDTGLTSPSWYWGVKSYNKSATTVNSQRIYNTNIPGIGYTLGIEDTSNCVGTTKYVTDPSNQNIICERKAGIWTTFIIKGKVKLTFYKTAGTTGSGTVPSTTVGAAILNDGGTWRTDSALIMNSFTVSTTACSVTNTAITVPLGTVLKTAFTGPNSTTAEKDFKIELDCDAATRVNLTLDDSTGQSPQTGVLALTTATSGPTATGIGVQVLHNDAPVTFGSKIDITTTQGAMFIPLKARYYQTAATVTGGQANSRATFTITYQ
ncbi:fimbrial protein [Serratia proteamaculans]|uniref:fimbrial protein n=1 Tax=Serratia proteamaculans TaxID=28151 RepID=UPI00217AA98F|nr:fimbrial protein [Serratia proteamaculans]CAI1525094.1 Type-1A pilin [Serratia proteamaculans]